MNIIFVDIDGVLLPSKMHLYPQNQKITPKNLNTEMPLFDNFAVQCFNIWAKYGDAKIIFSTNWALSMPTPEERLPEIMEHNGLKFDYHKEILTPKKFTSQRGSEIWWWLLDNAEDGDKFIAVDDDQSCRYLKEYTQRTDEYNHVEAPMITGEWIDIDYKNGLTWENLLQGCKALNIEFDDINEGEFGIKPMSPEDKLKYEEALDLLARCII